VIPDHLSIIDHDNSHGNDDDMRHIAGSVTIMMPGAAIWGRGRRGRDSCQGKLVSEALHRS
jgi:hypothetical protein